MGFVILIWVVGLIGLLIYFKPGFDIVRETKKLGNADVISNDEVNDYLNQIAEVSWVPNQPKYWNTCRAGYELVRSSSADQALKKKLKKVLLSKGVSGIR